MSVMRYVVAGLVACVAVAGLALGFPDEEEPTGDKPDATVPDKEGAGDEEAVEEAPAWPKIADGVELIYPPPNAVILDGEFNVICKTKDATLDVDGEEFLWDAFEPPLCVARVSLYSGRNTLQIGQRKVEVFVGRTADDPGGPDGWPLVHSHPIRRNKRCADCHETKEQDGRIAVGDLLSHEACFKCHEEVEFELVHSHPLEPIEHCQMCHSPHGSTRKALLKAPIKKLCADCHDS